MIYELIFMPDAERHLMEWRKSGQKKTIKKILDLLDELRHHPTTGTGQVEQLRGNMAGYWSRRIDKGSRMVYAIDDGRVVVTVVSMRGHYSDR
ncbi:MAG: Txe/YoeB family addiction module toxin [Muribaculaceae bacterium]|nr:Txe/YoeB family addiction module toxin [Muribaculaceae bacterium]